MTRTERITRAFLVPAIVWSVIHASHAQSTRDYAVEITASTQEAPPRITLNWRQTADGAQSVVSRKHRDSASWTQLAVLPPNTTSYTDSNVTVGQGYEYAITKTPTPNYPVSGYIYAGIKLPLVESRGKVLLLVENTYSTELDEAIRRLEQNLAGDGWSVIRRDVNRSQSPGQVRGIIQNVYYSDPSNVKAVFLLGRVPVPMSGNYEADDHSEHLGAWSADTYYADVNGNWTDFSVNNTSAVRPANRNVPGDGKFDQTVIPSDTELQVGRVDLSRLPAFAGLTEGDLLLRYLNKNDDFRHGRISAQRRAILYDGFGASGIEADAAAGWRNFAPFFSSANITETGSGGFFSNTASQDYLWSYISGGGGAEYDSMFGVGNTSDWVQKSPRTVFTMMFGSYFGDWDANDNFMRAALASSGYVLTAAWSGRPHWFFHHMALGETIGFSTRLSQNNDATYRPRQYRRYVHINLMGDPTLRMHVVAPPSNISASSANGVVTLNWTRSADESVLGYHVYRGASTRGPFSRVTNNPINTNTFSETVFSGSAATYMVRAIKLETSRSGSYYNASQGIFASTDASQPVQSSPFLLQEGPGKVVTAYLKGNTLMHQQTISTVASGWKLKGTADFNNDQSPDYLWNHNDGRIAVWYMQDTVKQGAATIRSPGGTWKVAGTGDFNGDSHPDILFQNADGFLALWYMHGRNSAGAASLRRPAAGWRVVCTPDWDGDSKPDIFFQHTDGRLAVWLMNGTSQRSGLALTRPGSQWRAVGLKDFNDDGNTDILFRQSNGQMAVWFMSGQTRSGAGIVNYSQGTSVKTAMPLSGR